MNRVIVTTSWDDGHILDFQLATLLKKYDLAGTFYIAPKNREIDPKSRLSDDDILTLSKDFEIGSHTMTHPVLTDVSLKEGAQEITSSKHYLEALLHKEVTSFCYPRGDFDKSITAEVRRAGYRYARTTEEYVLDLSGDINAMGTSLDAHRLPIPRLVQSLLQLARFCRWQPLRILKNISWERRAKTLFDNVLRDGGVFHLWGHSWALEKAGDWEKLERVLDYVHGRDGVQYLTNGELEGAKS